MVMDRLLELVYSLKAYGDSEKENALVDPDIANEIGSIDRLACVSYYLSAYDRYIKELPKTKIKINEVCLTHLQTEKIEWFLLRRFYSWFETETRLAILNKWLVDDTATDTSDFGVFVGDQEIMASNPRSVEILKKLVNMYNGHKSQRSVKIIENFFKLINKDYLDEACAVISEATPAVAASLLTRGDVKDEYMLGGLKAISKLSRQRNIDVKIDIKLLENLGPKSRLDAMYQLLGMLDAYVKYQTQMEASRKNNPNSYTGYSYYEQKLKARSKEYTLPFKEIPSKEEIEKFLFPCALKYNSEVSELVERYDKLFGQVTEKKI
jgi:hypothetical protein